ncbi:conserved hypothetical protein, secreted [Candidatus Magnetobacterium bavaricum]|uniref:DUF8213 domain-containing protein n=1 Tax=Candidatus Magnetobacterium bavaricum TaxID=29290 RepID=A0A0F3GSZ5_9BACT|nr:conserved hypothetical protein, secreted [Candidatus Magnetobacterium bavaricum]
MNKKSVFLFALTITVTIMIASLPLKLSASDSVDKPDIKVNLYSKSEEVIEGESVSLDSNGLKKPDSTINFSAKYSPEDKESIEINLLLKNKRIVVLMGKKRGNASIRGYDTNTNEVVSVTEDETEHLKALLAHMLEEKISEYLLGERFLRTLNIMYSWPVGLPLLYNESNTERADVYPKFDLEKYCEEKLSCNAPPYIKGVRRKRTPDSQDLCDKLNNTEWTGRYAKSGEKDMCVTKQTLRAQYDKEMSNCTFGLVRGIRETITAWSDPVKHQVGGEDCFGRCGKGCIGDIPRDFNRDNDVYTQNCFNHDLCVAEYGDSSNSYTGGPLCNRMLFDTLADAMWGTPCKRPNLMSPTLDSSINELYYPRFTWQAQKGEKSYRLVVVIGGPDEATNTVVLDGIVKCSGNDGTCVVPYNVLCETPNSVCECAVGQPGHAGSCYKISYKYDTTYRWAIRGTSKDSIPSNPASFKGVWGSQ